MTARLVFHVGLPKCGSTYLQAALANITPEQSKQHGLLPMIGSPMFLAAIGLAETWEWWGRPEKKIEGRWESIVETVHQSEGTVVVSSELFTYVPEEQAQRAMKDLEGVEVDLVVIARDLSSLLPSRWQQYLKTGTTDTFDEYLDDVFSETNLLAERRINLDPSGPCRVWGSQLDPKRIHVITMPPSGSPYGELWDRFAKAGGFEDFPVELPEELVNPAVGLAGAELLRRVNRHYSRDENPKVYGNMVKRLLAQDLLLSADHSPRPKLPADRMAQARDLAEGWRTRIEDAGYDVIGNLDDIVPKVPTGEIPPVPTVTVSESLDAAAEVMSDLLKRHRDLRQEVRRLTRELEAAQEAAERAAAKRGLFRR